MCGGPIRGPIESTPLALCDARSIEAKDFVPSDLIYRDKVGETYRFTYNPNHRWFYFPHLERNEVILLKCYDSKEDGRALHGTYRVRGSDERSRCGSAREYRGPGAGIPPLEADA
jgi:hypothetical protein